MEKKSKKIVFWGRADLLDSSVESILASLAGWEVVCVSNKAGIKALNMAVKKANPDIIIIRFEKNHTIPFLPMQIINDHPGIKVITLGFDNNSMEVYSKQTILIKQVSDLISVFEDNR